MNKSSAPVTTGLKVLVIGASRKRLDNLLDTLAAHAPEHHLIGRLDRAIDLPCWVAELEPDAIIIDTESPSRDTLEQVAAMSEAAPRPIVMFSRDESLEAMRSAEIAGVSCYVVNGVETERLEPLLRLAQARFEAWRGLRDEVMRARQELNDHKLIEQAKRHLMKMEKLSEEAAYQALRREAMNHGVRLADLARAVMRVAKGSSTG